MAAEFDLGSARPTYAQASPGTGSQNASTSSEGFDLASAKPSFPPAAPKSAYDTLMEHVRNGFGAMVEPTMALASGAIAKPLSDLAGLGSIATNALAGTEYDPAKTKQNAQTALTYVPRTEGGQEVTRGIGKVAGATLGRFSSAVGDSAAADAALVGASPETQAIARAGGQEFGDQVPSLLGTKLPAFGKGRIAAASKAAVETAPRQAALQAARDSGYPVPPSEISGTPVGDTLTTFAGKNELNNHLALASQKVTNRIARDDLGLSANDPFNHGALDKAQAAAEQKYQAVRNADQNLTLVRNADGSIAKYPGGKPIVRPAGPIKLDGDYASDIAKIDDGGANGAPGAQANEQVAKLKARLQGATSAFTPDDAIESLNRTRKEAQANLKNTTDPDKLQLGQAQMQAADALEAQIARYLQKGGQTSLYDAFAAGRTQLAKIRTIRDAMDTSGDVDAAAINAERHRTGGTKSPMSGGLLKIANAAETLPNTVKNTSKVQAPAPVSKLGMYFALAGGPGAGALGGHMAAGAGAGAGTAALLAGPWASRKFLGSDLYQSTLGGSTPTANALSRLAAKPASPLSGLLVTPQEPPQ